MPRKPMKATIPANAAAAYGMPYLPQDPFVGQFGMFPPPSSSQQMSFAPPQVHPGAAPVGAVPMQFEYGSMAEMPMEQYIDKYGAQYPTSQQIANDEGPEQVAPLRRRGSHDRKRQTPNASPVQTRRSSGDLPAAVRESPRSQHIGTQAQAPNRPNKYKEAIREWRNRGIARRNIKKANKLGVEPPPSKYNEQLFDRTEREKMDMLRMAPNRKAKYAIQAKLNASQDEPMQAKGVYESNADPYSLNFANGYPFHSAQQYQSYNAPGLNDSYAGMSANMQPVANTYTRYTDRQMGADSRAYGYEDEEYEPKQVQV